MKFVTPVSLVFALVLTAGCHRGRNSTEGGTPGSQPLPSAENARASYNAALAQTCGGKHLESLSPDDLRPRVQEFYMTLGASARDLYDKSTRKTCGGDPSSADCYNTGVMRAAMQDSKLQSLADHVCQYK